MDKLAGSFKAIVAVFHGIIATWVFTDFSERKVSEFEFVILLVFFTVANILIWNALFRGNQKFRAKPVTATTLDFQPESFRIGQGIGLTLIAICVGLVAAYIDRHDYVLRMGNSLADWERSSSAPPFEVMIHSVRVGRAGLIDIRDQKAVEAARADGAYLRIYVKNSQLAYEGFPARVSTKGEVNSREVVLSPACRLSAEAGNATKIATVQPIDGPGVFLRLNDVVAIEIVDALTSACAKLF
jgi:hypothetical protein